MVSSSRRRAAGGQVASPKPATVVDRAHTLRKQRAAVELLTADNARLKDQLQEESRFSLNPTSQAAKKLVSNLEAQDLVYERLIIEQQEAIERLMTKQAQLEDQVDAQRDAMGGINNALEVSIRAQRRVILLENRLEHAASAKSAAELTANELKQRVEGLRRERCLFDELTAKMYRGIESKAEEVSGVLKKTFETHDARNRADAMRNQVMSQQAKDVAEAEGEWQRLTQVIEADRARRAADQAQRAAEREKRMEALLRGIARGRSASRRRASRKKSNNTAVSTISDGYEHVEQLENEPQQPPAERLRQLKAILTEIAARIDGCNDSPEAVVQQLEDLRSQCFELFACLTEAYTRLEGLESKLEATRAEAAAAGRAKSEETAACSSSLVTDATSSTQRDYANAGSHLPTLNGASSQQQPMPPPTTATPLRDAERQVEAICKQLHTMCERLKHISPEINDVLHQDGPPSDTTLLHYLGVLEHWAASAMATTGCGAAALYGSAEGWNPPWVGVTGRIGSSDSDSGELAFIEPPSVELSEGTSVRSRSAGSAGRGRGLGWSSRKSVAESEGSGGNSPYGRTPGRALDLETLTQRAKRAAEARMATATAAAVRVHAVEHM